MNIDIPKKAQGDFRTAVEDNLITNWTNSPVQQEAIFTDTSIVIDGTKSYSTTKVVTGATRTITAATSGHVKGNNIKARYQFDVDCTLTLTNFDTAGNNTGTITPIPAGTYDLQFFANASGVNLEISQNIAASKLDLLTTDPQIIKSVISGDDDKTTGASDLAYAQKGYIDDADAALGVRIDNVSDGVQSYETKDDESTGQSFLPVVGVVQVAYKVTNDPDPNNNGNWSWNGSIYVPGAKTVVSYADPENTSDAVSGQAVTQNESYATSESISLNTYNPDTDLLNYYMALNGNLVPNGSYRVSDYMPVIEGKTYDSYRFVGSTWGLTNVRFITAFDDKFKADSGSGASSVNTYTVPVGIKYLRVSFFRSEEDRSQSFIDVTIDTKGLGEPYIIGKKILDQLISVKNVFQGTVQDEGDDDDSIISRKTFDDNSQPILDQGDTDYGLNLLNPFTITEGYLMNPSGSPSLDANYNYTDYIAVTEGLTYTGNVNGSTTNVFRKTAFYDGNKNVVSGGDPNFSYQFVVPAGAYFVIVSIRSEEDPSDYCLLEGTDTTYIVYANPTPVRWAQGFESDFDNDNDLATRKNVLESIGISSLVLNGADENAFINGTKYTREVKPFEAKGITFSNVFNFSSDAIGEEIVRTGTGDDVAPSHFLSTTLLANHSYYGCKYIGTAHGKDDNDIGSIYTDSVNTFVLVNIIDADNLWLMAEGDNSDVYPSGTTLTYVSGGVDTSNISVTTKDYRQAFPCYQDYELLIYADKRLIEENTGTFYYADNVVFNENYNLISRDSIVDWYKNDYDGTFNFVGDILLYNNVSYIYDVEGNCTITGDYTFNDAIQVQDIMALQAREVTAYLDKYYIPKTIEFDQNGTPLNFSMIEDATSITDAGGTSAFFTAAKLDASSIPSDRWLQLGTNKGFAMGFLPLGSAGDNRGSNVTNDTLEIRITTDKMYPRLVSKNAFISAVGESFSYIAYRNIFVPENGATANYPVRTNGNDYYYIDFHDTQSLKEFSMPNDFIGREFEIVESRNIACNATIISSKLVVNVDCLSDYGYIVLQINK